MLNSISMEIQMWPIDKLVFYARNPRKNDAAVDRMCSSIREFGFKIPCLVRSDGEVIDGHLRLKAARKLAIHDIPVILCDEWSPSQVKAFRLLVNRSPTWADWDEDLLSLELKELSTLAARGKSSDLDFFRRASAVTRFISIFQMLSSDIQNRCSSGWITHSAAVATK